MWLHKCMVGNAYIMHYADSVSGFATNVMCQPGSKGSPCTPYHPYHVDGSVQERRDPSALAMEFRIFCTNPSIQSRSRSPDIPRGEVYDPLRYFHMLILAQESMFNQGKITLTNNSFMINIFS